jgi:hypothetical protein
MRTGFLSLGMKRPWRETDCSLSSSAKAKNYYWGCTSTAPYTSTAPHAYALKAFRRPSSIDVNGRVSGPRTLQGKKLPRVPHVYNTLSTRICEPWVLIIPENSTSLIKDLPLDKKETPYCTVLTHSVTAASQITKFFAIGIIRTDGQEWSTLRGEVQKTYVRHGVMLLRHLTTHPKHWSSTAACNLLHRCTARCMNGC